MRENFLLGTRGAVRLYREYAAPLPIIDYHNHISVADIAADCRYENLTELWLAPDPYKHRLMRICGIAERFITGDAEPYEKFEKFCGIFPLLAGNPVYDWSRMELSALFGIEEMPTADSAARIYDKVGEMLKSPEYFCRSILSRFRIEYQSPVASLLDDLSPFGAAGVAPSLRADPLLSPTEGFLAGLRQATGAEISDTASYVMAVSVMLDRFDAAGCRFADHALDADFFEGDTDGKRAELLRLLGIEYARRGWTLLLHMNAKRQTSDRLARLAGPAGGYSGVGNRFDMAAVCDLLNGMESGGGLPDTVLFPLNLSDQAACAVLQGSFSEDGVASKVQLGPAWWWCDHAMGIGHALSCISSFGALSQFIGMTTDSRSILSFVRHDFFRRLLCTWIDAQNRRGDWELPMRLQGELVSKICYRNALDKIRRREKNCVQK